MTNRLLVVTQTVDTGDLFLGFFHRWLEELAPKFESIEVICLKEGKHDLPSNVRVHSLGKEKGKRHSVVYAYRFLSLAWNLRSEYDAVFVHMNQEYVLMGGWVWEILGKRVYLWRNHYAGSWLTDLAATFCRKVFYTSKHSYTAKYARSIRMPVGVDTERFFRGANVPPPTRSILFFARMMESKRPGLVIDALVELAKRGVSYTASFVGSAPRGEEQYVAALKQRVADAGLADRITFAPGVPNDKAVDVYQAHEIYINAGRSGMLDKTIFEAAASGCTVLAASDDWKEFAGEEFWFAGSADSLASRIELTFKSHSVSSSFGTIVENHSLHSLTERLGKELHG